MQRLDNPVNGQKWIIYPAGSMTREPTPHLKVNLFDSASSRLALSAIPRHTMCLLFYRGSFCVAKAEHSRFAFARYRRGWFAPITSRAACAWDARRRRISLAGIRLALRNRRRGGGRGGKRRLFKVLSERRALSKRRVTREAFARRNRRK